MLAIDTNILVRYLTGDHPQQSVRARTVIDGDEVFVSTTVLMEAEWVLRSVYGYARAKLADAFSAFAGLPSVTLEDPMVAATALGWMKQGMDFADALHLAKAEGCEAFVSFDRQLAKAAVAVGVVTVRTP